MSEPISKKVFLERYPSFTPGQLNRLLANRKNNGLDRCVSKLGRVIFIDPDCFWAWLRQFDDDGNNKS